MGGSMEVMKEITGFLAVLVRLIFLSLTVQILFNLTPIQGSIFAIFTLWFWIIARKRNKLKGDEKSEEKLDD
jgi:hypothetical protein